MAAAAANLAVKAILVGMGNSYLSDDAVGVRLVRDFNRRLGTVDNLEVIEECSAGGLRFASKISKKLRYNLH